MESPLEKALTCTKCTQNQLCRHFMGGGGTTPPRLYLKFSRTLDLKKIVKRKEKSTLQSSDTKKSILPTFNSFEMQCFSCIWQPSVHLSTREEQSRLRTHPPQTGNQKNRPETLTFNRNRAPDAEGYQIAFKAAFLRYFIYFPRVLSYLLCTKQWSFEKSSGVQLVRSKGQRVNVLLQIFIWV